MTSIGFLGVSITSMLFLMSACGGVSEDMETLAEQQLAISVAPIRKLDAQQERQATPNDSAHARRYTGISFKIKAGVQEGLTDETRSVEGTEGPQRESAAASEELALQPESHRIPFRPGLDTAAKP